MKGVRFLLATILFAFTIGLTMTAFASDGMNDSHGVWHDSAYWHERHPEWVYRYHPEWAVDHEDWWMADHRDHPGWFNYPYWHRYPVWSWGAYDRDHVWRGYGWWHEHDPGWFYEHHPEWAENHPYWIRDDHFRHPDWFHNAYWREHPHDWNHPEEAYHRDVNRYVESEHEHPETYAAQGHNLDEHHEGAGGQYHPTNQFHSSASTYHPPAPHTAVSSTHTSSSGSGHSGHH